MLDSIFSSNIGSISLINVSICILSSLILGLIVALTYKFTSKYNKSFLITISLLPLLVASVILMVSGDVGTSIATLGAFSLVRFRSIPGTSKEMLIVFFAMAIGLSIGMGHILLALLVTIVGCISIILFNKIKIFDNNNSEKILKVVIPENLDYTSMYDDEFTKYTNSVELMQAKTINMGSLYEVSYKVNLKKGINEKQFLDDLRIKNGNLKIILSHPLTSNEL